MTQNFLVNGLYPLEYFVLAGTDQIQYPQEFWWQSKARFALEGARGQYAANGNLTSEYLELDLSRIRQVNYLNFSIIRAPIDIIIQYDALSDTDSDHQWVNVTPVEDEPFDNQIHYAADHRSAWENVEFYFTDSQGHAINTRFIRIRFRRRDVDWPHKGAKPFRWPVMVRHLRPARQISEYKDTRGTLYDTGLPTGDANTDATHVNMNITDAEYDTDAQTNSGWIKQQFGVPFDLLRENEVPSIMGFSMLFFIEPNQPIQGFEDIPNETLTRLQWQLYDVTDRDASPTLIKSGITTGALTDKRGWVNVYFDSEETIQPILRGGELGRSSVYELWVKSLSVHVDAGDDLGVRQVMGKFIRQDNLMVGQTLLRGTATNGSPDIVFDSDGLANTLVHGDLIRQVAHGSPPYTVDSVAGDTVTLTANWTDDDVYTPFERVLPIDSGSGWDYTHSTCMHIWADVADNGRDVLGNQYRYATVKDSATSVLSKDGWLSQPQPSPNAVEALYFDTRYTDVDGHLQPGVIDAIRIAPQTPNIQMHVYFTENHGNATAPQNSRQWDRLIWNPIHQTYDLNGNATITLPTPIRASFVKLEFTKLQPRTNPQPNRPHGAAVEFRRYPTWIENQFDNATVRRTVEDWFHDRAKKSLVKINALKFVREPVLEFQYKEREFLAALATNKAMDKDARNSGLINTQKNTFIDPTTASKINVNTPSMFGSALTLLVDRSSILGQTVAAQTDIRTLGSVREGGTESDSSSVANVSTSNNRVRESFAHLAATPMWFNLAGRHIYKKDKAKFGKQAYYVGIQSVEFLRKDYSQQRDDVLISDNLYDTFLTETNTWQLDKPSRIAQLVGTDSDLLNPGHEVDLLITYTIDGVTYTDESGQFNYFDEEITLVNTGSTQAIGVQVYLDNSGIEGVLFTPGQDYVLNFHVDALTGEIVNTMKINTPNVRLIVGHITNTYDAGVIVGKAVIASNEVYTPA